MKFFVDTADIEQIEELIPTGFVDGVTTNPSLIAKGPTADDIFPQVPLQSTNEELIDTWAKLKSISISGIVDGDMIAALLSEENPPPNPSTCLALLSGLPKTVNNIESIC